MSKWDKPGIAESVESAWESADELLLRRLVAEWIGPNAGRVLDLGCGTARMAPLLAGCKYVGVDGSAEMLKLARKRVPSRSLRLCNFTTDRLPFPDQSFDVALCMQVIRHLPTYQPVLQELARVVKSAVYFQDIFNDGPAHVYGTMEYGGVPFYENAWSAALFVEDARALWPGWTVERRSLAGMWAGIRIGKGERE